MKSGAKDQRFFEYAISSDLRVDKDAGVIRNVKVLGYDSRNGRRYTPQAAGAALKLYEGVPVNANHPSPGAESRERPIEDRFGWLENVTQKKDGLYADLRYLKTDPRAAKVAEIAESRPGLIGLSHHAFGQGKQAGGTLLVEQITRVKSVDLVCDPATTRGLFESEGYAMDDNAMGAAPAAGSGDMTWDIFSAESKKVYDGDGDSAAKAKAIGMLAKKLFKLADELASVTNPEKPAVDKKEETPAEEAAREKKLPADVLALQEELRQMKTERECLSLLESTGIKPDAIKLRALAALTSAEDRKSLAETWKVAAESQRPRSAGPLSLFESRGDDAAFKPFEKSTDFAALLRR